MSSHDPDVPLRQMLDSAREVTSLAQGKNRADLDTDRLLNLSIVRLLEVMGGAANRVPTEDHMLYPEIPWSQIIGLRNRLICGYDEVDFDVLYQIITVDLPPLVAALEAIILRSGSVE